MSGAVESEMKINPLNEAALAAVAAVGAAKTERGAPAPLPVAASPAVSTASPGVPVSVSASALALDGVSAGSGINEAKVAAVRAAIENGTFKVDAGAIADKLLSNAQEFLNRAGG